MKILISGGGTGGHIYPALAIADKLKESISDAKIIYVGTKGSMEEDLAAKAGYEFKAIRVKGMPRKFDKRSLVAIWNLMWGIMDSRQLLKELKPVLVVGTGGYVSGPIAFVAGLCGIPVAIHEQNAFPGITNKLLSKFADKVLITYPDSARHFKYPNKTVVTGNPIRKDITGISKIDAILNLGLDNTKKFILSFGGSGGQKNLNNAFLEILTQNLWPEDFQLLHITGERHYGAFMQALEKSGKILSDRIRIEPYFHSMPAALNAADIVVSSGGAITLAEISAVGLPSILIPKAYTAENHQEYNARAFEKAGAAEVFLETEFNGEKLLGKLQDLLSNEELLHQMSKCSRELGRPDAAAAIEIELAKLLKI